MLHEIDHVQLPVPDLSLATDWYTTHLGFTVDNRHEPAHVSLRLGSGPELYLWQTSDPTAATFTVKGQPFATVGVRVVDIAALHDQLVAAGTQIIVFQDEGYARVLKFFDPFGNMWISYEFNEARHES